jgi:hypothetical protein
MAARRVSGGGVVAVLADDLVAVVSGRTVAAPVSVLGPVAVCLGIVAGELVIAVRL